MGATLAGTVIVLVALVVLIVAVPFFVVRDTVNVPLAELGK